MLMLSLRFENQAFRLRTDTLGEGCSVDFNPGYALALECDAILVSTHMDSLCR